MLAMSHVLELYSYIQIKYLSWLLPAIKGDLAQIQPSLFSISDVFAIADDSRARKSPEQGGLGYNAPLTTIEAICKQLLDWNEKADAKETFVEEKVGPLRVTEVRVDVNVAAPVKKF